MRPPLVTSIRRQWKHRNVTKCSPPSVYVRPSAVTLQIYEYEKSARCPRRIEARQNPQRHKARFRLVSDRSLKVCYDRALTNLEGAYILRCVDF